MCGFVGVRRPGLGVERGELESMLSTIRHRGPEGEGFHLDGPVGLGFCRLAIIDLEGGAQPLANEEGSVWLVFNGEIYNFEELTLELAARGHRFRGRSDSETVVHAYEEWGERCVERLRGIFAFAIWDSAAERLFLATDRSGVKPLYLAETGDELVFASEAKAVLASGRLERELDLLGLLGGEEVDPRLARSTFRGVSQLGPGCTLSVAGEGRRLRRYWSYAPSTAAEGGCVETFVETFREAFHRTVGMQLVADVPVAVSLSGGLDSSAVAASVFRHGRSDVVTYTARFDDDDSRDLDYARRLAGALGLPNREVPCGMTAATADEIPLVAWLAEGDFDLGFVARYRLARAVRADGAKVLLSGQGFDEIVAGYDRSYDDYLGRTLYRHLSTALAPVREMPAFGPQILDRVRADLAARPGTTAGASALSEVVSTQLKRDHSRLHSYLLRFEDRMGMAGHVEVRVPFLDHPLLELCAGASEEMRRRLFDGKAVLRQAVSRWLPDEIARRPKEGGFNSGSPRLTRLVLEQPDCDLADLVSRETVEKKGYFQWPYCRHLLHGKDYRTLDSVFIIHLLDELFVSDFDPARFALG